MATINSVGNSLTGSTGSGAFVGATSPTLVTPTLGAALATSINFGGSSLSDYVNGSSFAATIAFGGASVGITYSANAVYYTRIGNIIFYTFNISLTSKGSSTGSATISTFPANSGIQSFNSVVTYLNMTSVTANPVLQFTGGSATANILSSTTAALTDANFNNNTTILGNGFYLI
jgi:hypothetical protein